MAVYKKGLGEIVGELHQASMKTANTFLDIGERLMKERADSDLARMKAQLEKDTNDFMNSLSQDGDFESWGQKRQDYFEKIKSSMTDKNSPYYCRNNFTGDAFGRLLDNYNVQTDDQVQKKYIAAQKDYVHTQNAQTMQENFKNSNGVNKSLALNLNYELVDGEVESGILSYSQGEKLKDELYSQGLLDGIGDYYNAASEQGLLERWDEKTFNAKFDEYISEFDTFTKNIVGERATVDKEGLMKKAKEQAKHEYAGLVRQHQEETNEKFKVQNEDLMLKVRSLSFSDADTMLRDLEKQINRIHSTDLYDIGEDNRRAREFELLNLKNDVESLKAAKASTPASARASSNSAAGNVKYKLEQEALAKKVKTDMPSLIEEVMKDPQSDMTMRDLINASLRNLNDEMEASYWVDFEKYGPDIAGLNKINYIENLNQDIMDEIQKYLPKECQTAWNNAYNATKTYLKKLDKEIDADTDLTDSQKLYKKNELSRREREFISYMADSISGENLKTLTPDKIVKYQTAYAVAYAMNDGRERRTDTVRLNVKDEADYLDMLSALQNKANVWTDKDGKEHWNDEKLYQRMLDSEMNTINAGCIIQTVKNKTGKDVKISSVFLQTDTEAEDVDSVLNYTVTGIPNLEGKPIRCTARKNAKWENELSIEVKIDNKWVPFNRKDVCTYEDYKKLGKEKAKARMKEVEEDYDKAKANTQKVRKQVTEEQKGKLRNKFEKDAKNAIASKTPPEWIKKDPLLQDKWNNFISAYSNNRLPQQAYDSFLQEMVRWYDQYEGREAWKDVR